VARASTKAAAPAEDCNPAWLDGRHHQWRRGGAAARCGGRSASTRWLWRPQGRRNGVLTWVATGRSAGVGEGVCGAVTRKEAALVGEADRRRGEGEAEEAGGRRRAWLPRVRVLLAGGSGFGAGGAAPGASVLLLFSPFSFSSGLRVGGQGIGSPEAARVGRAMGGRGGGFL
jgi:hypothetical protein